MPLNIENHSSLQQHIWFHHSATYKHFRVMQNNRYYFIYMEFRERTHDICLMLDCRNNSYLRNVLPPTHPTTQQHINYLFVAISQTGACSYIHTHTQMHWHIRWNTTCSFTPAYSAPSRPLQILRSPTRRCLWRISAAHRTAGLSVLISFSLCTHSAITPLPWWVAAV